MSNNLTPRAQMEALDALIISLLTTLDLEPAQTDSLMESAISSLKNRLSFPDVYKKQAIKYLDDMWATLSAEADGH